MKKFISWEEIDTLVDSLSAQIILDCKKNGTTPKERYKGIYALQRGGLIPGVMLSHRLDIPMIDRLQSYYGREFLIIALKARTTKKDASVISLYTIF